MDKENMNEFPEQEADLTADGQENLQADEEEAPEREIGDDEATVSDEQTQVSFEETAEEPEDGDGDDELCLVCGDRKRAEGSDYCPECEAIMLSRKIPLLGWISGLACVIASVFALVLAMLVSAPVLQIARGDAYADDKRWYSAYKEYQEVDSVVAEVNSALGGESPFVQTGSGLDVRIVNTVANCYTPLEAISVAESRLGSDKMSKLPSLKKYNEIREEYLSSYEALADAIEAMTSGEADAQTTYAAFEAARGKEGVSDVYLNFFLFNAAVYYEEGYEKQIEYLEAAEKSAKASKRDFSWLYYQDFADVLYKAGEPDRAMEYLDVLTEKDKSKFGAYELKMRIALSQGDKDEASKILAQFKNYNEGFDTAYVLEVTFLRCTGEFEKAKLLCKEALEDYDSVPELHRQLALLYLIDGDYDNAFEEAFAADNNAYYLYAYMGDSSAYTPQLNSTLYLCTYLCKESGKKDTENAQYIDDILASFSEEDLTEQVKSIIGGEKTVEEVLTEGGCDLA